MWKKIFFLACVVHCAFSNVNIRSAKGPETALPISVVWDSKSESAYYVDFGVLKCDASHPCFYRYDSIADKTYGAYIEGQLVSSPSFIIPLNTHTKSLHEFAIGFGNYVYIIEWNGCTQSARLVRKVIGIDENNPVSRLAIAHRDENGKNLYIGTFNIGLCNAPANSSVYLYRKGKSLQQLFTGVRTSTGFAFDKKRGYTYFIDSCSLQIVGFKSDSNGNICQGRIVFDFRSLGFKEGEFYPFGLEADSDGNLWAASYTDGWLWKINPRTSTAYQVVKLPFNGLTSVSFGGDNGHGEDLYVTVASALLDPLSGKVSQTNKPGTSLYRISGLGKGTAFKRLSII